MRLGRSTTRRRMLLMLAVVNGVVLYLNFKVFTVDDLKQYSEELSANLKRLRLLDSTYLDQWTSVEKKQQQQQQQEETGEGFVWEKVENLHLALPAYEKMRHTLSRLQDFQFMFSKRVSQLSITQEMLTYKSILWRGDVERLGKLFVEVLQTNRSIRVGVLGGRLSGQTICPQRACLYIDHVRHWLEKILQTTVTLHNAALPSASSDYFAWCAEPHLDIQNMDIIIWELATEDYVMRSHIDKRRYDHAAQPQELLLRQLNSLPSKPFLINVNFMSPESIQNKDCVNSEYYAGRFLSKHYNITSISWCAAVCTSLWELGFTPDELIHSGDLLSARAHEQAAFFVINLMKGILNAVAVDHMNQTRTNAKYLQKLVSLHDVFVANSRDEATSEKERSDRAPVLLYNTTNKSALLSNGNKAIETKQNLDPSLSIADVKNKTQNNSYYTYQLLPIPPRRIKQKRSRFPTKWINNPVCWPLSKPQFVDKHGLTLTRNEGWEEGISDRENWYTSGNAQNILEFAFEMAPSAGNQTCVVALAIMACDYCGQALAWLDRDFNRAVLIGGSWAGHAFRVVEVIQNVAPGLHTLNLKSLEDKPFKLSAIMTAHKDTRKF